MTAMGFDANPPPHRRMTAAIGVRQRLPKPAAHVLQICTFPPFRDSSFCTTVRYWLESTRGPVWMVLVGQVEAKGGNGHCVSLSLRGHLLPTAGVP
jgi:hypothetical protein